MNIIVLHGEDIEKSYGRLKKFIDTAKERSWEVVYLEESPRNLEENFRTGSLFGNERFFILNGIKTLSKKDISWIKEGRNTLSGNLIIYNEGPLAPSFLKDLPKESKIEEFKLPKLVWSFLDYIYPGNSPKVTIYLHKVLEKEAPEFLFSLISKLFRDLYWVLLDSKTIPYPSWRVGKLKAQASKFQKKQLASILAELARIDFKSKTGKADLVSELDLMFIKYLQ